MVNTAFAWQFTWGCKFEGNFALDLTVVCTFLHQTCKEQIFRAVFAASGWEGMRVLFSGAGFVCCPGSPLFLTG